MKINYVFFGTDRFAVLVLEELYRHDFLPKLIITVPDKPQGKHQLIVPAAAKVWAETHKVPVLQPEKLDQEFISHLSKQVWDVFIVASYGKIIPQKILDIPKRKTLNVHPSLLPKLRGSSPLENAIIKEDKTGVTIMRLDSQMDHGPIVAQEESDATLPLPRNILEEKLARHGGVLLSKILPEWILGNIEEKNQDENIATYTEKIKKEDGLLDLSKTNESYRKILAFQSWPGTHFITERNGKKIRVIVTEALLKDGELVIQKVKPEGKKEMQYTDFLRGERKN